MVQQVHRRYEAYVGFVTTPQYFDDSPQQFLQVAPAGTGILQRVNHIDGYQYELGERAGNFDLLQESAVCLGRSFCDVIGQVGSNWVHCNGTSPDDIERICAPTSRSRRVPDSSWPVTDGGVDVPSDVESLVDGDSRAWVDGDGDQAVSYMTDGARFVPTDTWLPEESQVKFLRR